MRPGPVAEHSPAVHVLGSPEQPPSPAAEQTLKTSPATLPRQAAIPCADGQPCTGTKKAKEGSRNATGSRNVLQPAHDGLPLGRQWKCPGSSSVTPLHTRGGSPSLPITPYLFPSSFTPKPTPNSDAAVSPSVTPFQGSRGSEPQQSSPCAQTPALRFPGSPPSPPSPSLPQRKAPAVPRPDLAPSSSPTSFT